MTVKELKDVIELMDDDAKVGICVNEPAGWTCPDGCVVDIASAGFDWHQGEVLVVPKHKLDIHDVKEWEYLQQKTKPEPDKKDIFMNGMTVEEYIKDLDDAYEASKGSKMVFK